MLTKLVHQTKLVWSLDFSSQTKHDWIEEVLSSEELNGVRIVFEKEHEAEIVQFLQRLKNKQNHQSILPVVLDLSSERASDTKGKKKSPSPDDINFKSLQALKNFDIEYALVSGFSKPEDLDKIKAKLNEIFETPPWLLLRLDHGEIYEKLPKLLEHVAGVIISRIELAQSLEPATIPMVTKNIIRTCHQQAKIVIVASEMLASMRHNPTPTRAEVSDIANAVMDGADAFLLSEELSHGNYLLRAINVCKSTVAEVEHHQGLIPNWQRKELVIENEFDAVTYHAVKTAERVDAKAIVCITKEGNTALRLASYGLSVPIIAVTFSEQVKQKLLLVRGVSSVVLDVSPSLDNVLPMVNDRLKKSSWLSSGDKIVFVTVTISSVGQDASNLFTVQRLE